MKEILTRKIIQLEVESTELKTGVVQLEKIVEEQESIFAVLKTGKDDRSLLNTQQSSTRAAVLRTCRELRVSDSSLTSGEYWIDPDGSGVGDDPILVYCNMTTG